MKFTTTFALQSQGARLLERTPYTRGCRCQTGHSPSLAFFSNRLTSVLQLAIHFSITIKSYTHPNFHDVLVPAHSPLLKESCLVSHPLLTYMLKFSRLADLTSCVMGTTTSTILMQYIMCVCARSKQHRTHMHAQACIYGSGSAHMSHMH